MRLIPVLALLLLAACSSLTADVRGRVVDQDNRPVPGAQVMLSSYPSSRDETARPALVSNEEGEFEGELTFPTKKGAYVLAMKPSRTVGGIARFNHDRDPVTIVVRPMKRVTGRVSYEKLPKMLREYEMPAGFRFRTIHVLTENSREFITSARLGDGAFEFLIPEGKYTARIMGLHEILLVPFEVKVADVDLGTLEVIPSKDLTVFGAPAPELRFADARGIAKEGGLAALKGKWVLLYFWDHRMTSNTHWLQALIPFYNGHPELRDRMEVVGVHNCDDVLTVGELDRARTRKTGVSGFEAIPFPVGIDDDEKTFNAYGLVRGMRRSSPRYYLITPEGIVDYIPMVVNLTDLLKAKLGVN